MNAEVDVFPAVVGFLVADKRKQQTMQQHHESSNTIPYKPRKQIPLH
jgi:hypothetical protein